MRSEIWALCVALLTPASLLAFVLAAWRLGADLGFTGEFVIYQGLFSHWIVWAAVGMGIQFSANTLKRGLLQPVVENGREPVAR
jgi:NADH:ubiquinone oxidoreductase subunit 4 (subunit M)